MKSLKLKLSSEAPVIPHNPHVLSDPLNAVTKDFKAISQKRTKTDDDHALMAKMEWLCSLYTHPESGKIVIPGSNIEKMIRDAAAKVKRGKDVLSSFLVPDDPALLYDGPKDPEALYEDKQFVFRHTVVVNRARIIRTRPIFPVWSLEFECIYNEANLSEDFLGRCFELAGMNIGLCDWRPKYGRFSLEYLKSK